MEQLITCMMAKVVAKIKPVGPGSSKDHHYLSIYDVLHCNPPLVQIYHAFDSNNRFVSDIHCYGSVFTHTSSESS